MADDSRAKRMALRVCECCGAKKLVLASNLRKDRTRRCVDCRKAYQRSAAYREKMIEAFGRLQNNGRTPPQPTSLQPGSEEKIQLMEWRVKMGYTPTHPRDRQARNTTSDGSSAALWRPTSAPDAEATEINYPDERSGAKLKRRKRDKSGECRSRVS